MRKLKLKIVTLPSYKDLPLPEQKTDGSAGLDLYCTEDISIMPGQKADISTGIKMQLPAGYWGRITGRSSTFMLGLDVREGVIDEDFRGELFVGVFNMSDSVISINKGRSIAQLIIMERFPVKVKLVDKLDVSARGEKGFGSTTPKRAISIGEEQYIIEDWAKGQSIYEVAVRRQLDINDVHKAVQPHMGDMQRHHRIIPDLTSKQVSLIAGCMVSHSISKIGDDYNGPRLLLGSEIMHYDLFQAKRSILHNIVTKEIQYGDSFATTILPHPNINVISNAIYLSGLDECGIAWLLADLIMVKKFAFVKYASMRCMDDLIKRNLKRHNIQVISGNGFLALRPLDKIRSILFRHVPQVLSLTPVYTI